MSFRGSSGFRDNVLPWTATSKATLDSLVTAVIVILGAGAPDVNTGSDGDYWENNVTGELWGPKASGVWPTFPRSVRQPRIPLDPIVGEMIPPAGMSAAGAGVILGANNQARFVLTYFPRSGTVDAAEFVVLTTPGEASSTARAMLYLPDNTARRGMPGSVVADAGATATAATGTKLQAFTAVAVTAGWYWSGLLCENAVTTRPTIQVCTIGHGSAMPVAAGQTAAIASLGPITMASGASSLAAVAFATPGSGSAPFIKWRYATVTA